MNCTNCKAEWTPPRGVSITLCPFCGKPLFDVQNSTENAEPHEILLSIVKQYGRKKLNDTLLKGMLLDLMPHVEKKYQRIFKQALDDKVGSKLLDLENEYDSVRIIRISSLKDSFKNNNGFDHTADYVVDCFLFALGWITFKPAVKRNHQEAFENQLVKKKQSHLPINGLIAYYPFNGNANDESGNGNHGIVNGANLTTDRFGNSNHAYDFNGLNNSIVVPNSHSLNLSTNMFSISFWLKIRNYSTNGEMMLITKYSGVGTTTTGFMMEFDGTNFVYRYADALKNGGWGVLYITTKKLPAKLAWMHFAITTEKGIDKLYLNGILVVSNTIPHYFNIGSNRQSLRFGIGPPQNSQSYFSGSMDDVRIFNRAISLSEIKDLYNE